VRNILHVVDSFGITDGCARVVQELAIEQQRRGDRVRVLAGCGEGAHLLQGSGVTFDVLPVLGHRRRSVTSMLRGVVAIRRFCAQWQADIIHAHHFYAANIAALAGYRRRLVQTVHASLPCTGRLPHHPARQAIAVSDATRSAMLRCDPAVASRATVVYNGVRCPDCSGDTAPRENHAVVPEERPPALLFAGRFVEEKGWRVLIDAVARLPVADRPLLHVAGAGPDEPLLRQALADSSQPHVWHGETRGLHALFAAADVLVLPSLRMEGFPIVLLEAGLHATPVVASRTDGVPELIDDGRSGVLTPPGDSASLSAALLHVLQDRNRRRAYAAALAATVREKFTVERMTDGVDAVYAALFGQR
jgi:glycosyltransferase involved in cell wall biosynthesis